MPVIHMCWKLWIYLFGKKLLSTSSVPGTKDTQQTRQEKKLPAITSPVI